MNLYSQDKEPVAWMFRNNNNDNNENPQVFNPNDFLQTKMLFGFQWAASKEMNDALGNNVYANHGYPSYLNNSTNPLKIINQPTWFDGTDYNISAWNAPFMTYEPTLPLTSTGSNFGEILRLADESNPIFGFKARNGTIINTTTDPNYSRLVLTTNLVVSTPVTVLENIEPQPKFKSRTMAVFKAEGQTDNYLGKKWFLTINLRRLDYVTDNLVNDDIILSLKIHYKLGSGSSTGDIKFQNIPMQGLANYETISDNLGFIQDNRGKAQLMELAPSNTDVVYIRRNMLPISDANHPVPDITLSAEFWNYVNPDPNPDFNQNPMFTADVTDPLYSSKITDIDIEVQYYGHTDLAIDYVRIESINAHYLLRGLVDETEPEDPDDIDRRGRTNLHSDPDEPYPYNDPEKYEQVNDMYYIIQDCLDKMKIKSSDYDAAKLFRFYYQDTECDKFYWWGPLRYCNLVTNGMFMPRDEIAYPKIYEYYTKSRTRWIGTTFSNADRLMAAPFLRNGTDDYQTMALKFGFISCKLDDYHIIHFPDSLNSNYETALYDDNPNDANIPDFSWLSNDSYYFGTLLNPPNVMGLQASWERVLYNKFYENTRKQKDLFYSEVPWLDYFLFYNITLENVGGNLKLRNQYKRQKTAEELRLFIWSDLIRACKGILFDGDWNAQIPTMHAGQASIGDNTKLPANDLYSNVVGSDFIDGTNTWNEDGLIKYVDIPSMNNKMHIQPNRIYIGTKSIRTELWKTNQFLIKNNDLLMDLRLAASYSKGFRTWNNYDEDTYGTTNVMNRFLSLGLDNTPNRLKTRKLWNAEENAIQESYEDIDSSFVDFSLLRPSQDESLEGNVFYIGVQNKRTDPLIYYTEPRYDLIMPPPAPTGPFDKKYLKFLSTAEFDILTQSGGKDPDYTFNHNLSASDWQYYYWKRLGCREITIPFNYCDPNNGNDYNLLHVTEVKADDALDSSWPWWRRERFNNSVDIVIGQNGSIPVNFLPGEGKIFKVEVLKPNSTVGNLAYSNQSKFVVFPEYDVNGVALDNKIRYHLTYHKPDPARGGIMSVFYQRSFPMLKVTGEENLQILWEAPVCVSEMIDIPGEDPPANPYNNLPAYYPSIVVRRDNNSTMAYIVYSTEIEGPQSTCNEQYCPPEFDLCKRFKNPICEAIVETGGLTPNVISRTAIQNVVKGYRDNYGTPVINSGYLGNYYAWSDSLCGIVVGYKDAGQTFLWDKESFSNKIEFDTEVPNYANHPSINISSILDKQENDCSVVWQESEDLNSATSIYYTKFRLDGSGDLERFLATRVTRIGRIEIENDCIKLSYNVSGQMPTVYRNLSAIGSSLDNYVQYEVIAWHTNPNLNIEKRTIMSTYISSGPNPDRAFVFPIRKIIGNSFVLNTTHLFSNPVMSQITSYNLESSLLSTGGSQFEYLLNFEDRWQNSLFLTSGNKIYHLRESYFPKDVKLSDFGVTVYPVAEGQYPHLAYSPVENENGNVWKNHRVYNNGTINGVPKIVPNPIYFHSFNQCPSCPVAQTLVGFEDPFKGGGIGNTTMRYPGGIPVPEPLPINLPYLAVSDSLGEYVVPVQHDTIYTDWVLIDSTAELQYLVTMKDTTTVLFKLQKLSDSSFVDLPAPYTPGITISHQVFYLVNGNNDQYRLAMINTDSLLEYSENMYFEAPDVVDTTYAKRSYEVMQNVVNLNKHILIDKIFNLSCMPNPAKEILNVAIYANQNTNVESVVLQLYNQQGMMVWENNSRINSSAAIPVDDFSNGMYLIRANITTKDGFYTETSKVLILK